jgi:MFS family permease
MKVRSPLARRARVAVAVAFFINGAGGASWFVRIPSIRDELALSNRELGLALLGMPAGALVAMAVAGWLISRVGSRTVMKASSIGFCLALPLLALAPNRSSLIAALVCFGAMDGAIGASMNAHGVSVEARYGRPIMSSFHAQFSLGGMVGAAVGGSIAALGIDPLAHLLTVAITLGVTVVSFSRWLLDDDQGRRRSEPILARPNRSLAALGVVAFCVLLGEGAMADWSAVYLHDSLEAGEGTAAAGFTAFSVAMVAGRLSGDQLASKLGPVVLVRAGGALAAAGLGLGVVSGSVVGALTGFGCVGAGLSFIFPIACSAAGRTPSMQPAAAIAAMSSVGYLGFLAGPPFIGFVAEVFTLSWALGLVALLIALIVVLAGSVDRAIGPQEHREIILMTVLP